MESVASAVSGTVAQCVTRRVSEARRRASRMNGRLGRGPKTAQGKARAAQNARRHGLSRPAALEPALANDLLALARGIAGPDAGAERFEMAFAIAGAAIDVARVRRARADLLSAAPLDENAIARAAALDRYERRALSRRKRAVRRFDAAFPQLAKRTQECRGEACRAPTAARSRSKVGRTNPTGACRRRAFGPNEPRADLHRGVISAKRTRAIGVTAPRFGRTNPARAGPMSSRLRAPAPPAPS
jgi:hypothetical protein